ncbi:hypothetical protein KAU11_07990, partial [Candidatus Babeliales bacterium]|nr:hypothetical protein [Candidatus Babeliales bacterium]
YEKQHQIFKLLSEGKSPTEIRKAVGCSKNTFAKYKKEFEKMMQKAEGEKGEGESSEALDMTGKSPLEIVTTTGKMFNVLDLARTEKDLGEMGAQGGMVIGSIIDDFTSAGDMSKPPAVRYAKVGRGIYATASMVFSGVETWRQLNAQRKLKQEVQLTTVTRSELKEQILALVKAKEKIEIETIAKELEVDEGRVVGAINALESEGKLEKVK